MKIIPKGPGDADLSQAVQKENKVGIAHPEDRPETPSSGTSASVKISLAARKLQQVAELARKGDELRAEKVKALKEQIDSGEYRVDSADVAKNIVRSEVARLLEKK